MAAFTSVQTGNWNDAATWDVGGGAYPGSTSGQNDTVTIAAGHIVTLNINTFPGVVSTVTIDETGELYVAVKFDAQNKFYVGTWTVYGTVRFKNDEAGTYELRICRSSSMYIKSGGKIEAISKNFDIKAYHRINFDQEAISNSTNLIVESGGEVEVEGWEKTQKTHLTATMASGTKTINVADDYRWEINDNIVLVKGPLTTYKKLASKNSDLSWELNSTVTTEYLENTMVYNMSKSVTFGNLGNQSRAARIDISPGATAIIKNTYLYGGALSQLKEIGIYDTITMYGIYVTVSTAITAGINLKNIFLYCWGINWDAFILSSDLYKCENCDIINASTDVRNQGIVSYNASGIMKNVWVDAVGGCVYDKIGHLTWDGGGICNATTTAISTSLAAHAGNYKLSNFNFGYTEGGLNFPNLIDITPNSGLWLLDGCKFSASDVEIVTPTTSLYGVVSINHNKISGERREWQKYGFLTTSTSEARSGKCLEIHPSSTINPFFLRISFPCTMAKTPQLKFWAKGEGLGSITCITGCHSCGGLKVLAASGSLDENSQFIVGADWTQFTINFDGISAFSSEVEIVLEICDSSSGIFYIDDITISGNLA